MGNKTKLSLVLPRPVKCPCEKGLLVPLLRPVREQSLPPHTPVIVYWGNGYQLTWECTSCGKVVPKL